MLSQSTRSKLRIEWIKYRNWEVKIPVWAIVLTIVVVLLLRTKIVFARDYLMVKRACGSQEVRLVEYQLWTGAPLELQLVCGTK